jgi:hypothetical protein
MKSMSIRTAATVGLAGALLMFIGDMCLYGHWGSGVDFAPNLPRVIAEESEAQIITGGFVGPIAALLYCAGFFAVYKMISPKSPLLALMVAGSFSVAIIFGGTYHATWGIRALLMKGGMPSGPLASLYDQAMQYMHLFFKTMAALGGVAAVLLMYVVLWRRSLYPRWTVIVNPALLYLLAPLARSIPSPLGAIVVGGYYNLMFMAFFLGTIFCARSRIDPDQTHAARQFENRR